MSGVGAEEFFLGVYMTAVTEGELLTKVSVPAAGHARDGFAAVTIGADGTCIVNVAAALDADGGPRLAIGCVDAVPVVLSPESTEEDAVRTAVHDAGLEPPSDVHATADYRRHLAEVCAVRASLRPSPERGREPCQSRSRAPRSPSRSTARATSARSRRAVCSSTSSATTST